MKITESFELFFHSLFVHSMQNLWKQLNFAFKDAYILHSFSLKQEMNITWVNISLFPNHIINKLFDGNIFQKL